MFPFFVPCISFPHEAHFCPLFSVFRQDSQNSLRGPGSINRDMAMTWSPAARSTVPVTIELSITHTSLALEAGSRSNRNAAHPVEIYILRGAVLHSYVKCAIGRDFELVSAAAISTLLIVVVVTPTIVIVVTVARRRDPARYCRTG